MGKYSKAIVGALTAGLAALGTALGDDVVTQLEWVGVGIAVLGAAGLIWAVPNAPADSSH